VKRFLIAILLCSSLAWAADTTVTVKAVTMETGAYATATVGGTYNWHSMLAEVDGVTYKIANIYLVHEEWLHKGTYTGRWRNSGHTKLEVDTTDGDKVRHLEFKVLGEE
jgi:hypothetical protein